MRSIWLELRVFGISWRFGMPFWDVFWVLQGASGGLGGPEATGKGFERAWVGPRAAGDLEMGPTWSQLEPR